MRVLHFLWLFLIPFWQILLGNEVFLVSSQCLDDQKSLLLQLKGSLQYESSLSNKLARWNQNTSECCKWNGVSCDSSGHAIALELDNETISSGIEKSSALFSLQYLEKLNLAYNRFNVGIPVGIDNLTNLKFLNLSNAGFVGQIPRSIGKLQILESLDLSSNHVSGEIPSELANLTFIAALNLSFNNLSGEIPRSNQFQTFSADSFYGNIGLCGLPLNKSCGSDAPELKPAPSSQDDSYDWQFIFFLNVFSFCTSVYM